MKPLASDIRAAVQAALVEDLGFGDVTTESLFPQPVVARATITAHQSLVVAGVEVAQKVFREVDPSVKIVRALAEGTAVRSGTPVLVLDGDGRSLLKAERVALNFLQHLSGIATLTASFCAAVRGYPTRILDTRKTTPGLRALQKWAVRLGGGFNHRHSLGDGLLIKDNHLALLRAQNIGVAEACRLAREQGSHGLRIIVEVQSLDQIPEALEGKADVILLDNMTPSQVRTGIGRIKDRAQVEVSGGLTVASARELAAAGAHFLSIGALTHSAPAVDLSLDLTPRRKVRAPHK
jgi:nicotinate-nucleotide pyrophosphorylase (carboxylating)